MKRIGIGIACGVLLIGVGGLAFAFTQSMKPDADEEAKAIARTKPYVADFFNDAEVTTEMLYDNMRNFPFEYVATVVDGVTATLEDSVETAFGPDVTYAVLYDEATLRDLDV